ncbi:Tfx family DNA-binding protein [Halobacterium litoreum]|uniref:Tfx family DNA-binding protein n=1 Tax=Halobacterium litoreum TaxID=2039234 RepID=A0ABD5NEQ3_9EURY|nr:Tfx family DNA-binding protein [Halobacterium litoreum]UHH13516.1 Tfx family DNA-binding protein [Halobacterium litoreum]
MNGDAPDADALLSKVGFDAAESVLTRRQAEVLALRERDVPQADIADRLGTSRANISKVESSARANVRKARETVAFADALRAPVHVTVEAGTDLYDVPDAVYDAADDANVAVSLSAPEVMKRVSEVGEDAVADREVSTRLLLTVDADGDLRVRAAPDDE